MATLLIPLVGPLQSWGLDSRFDLRLTAQEPSFSGVIGLVCAALGRDRSEPVADLAALNFGVRADAEGVLLRDFHTVQGCITASGAKGGTAVTSRWYLADAAFTAALEGPAELLGQIHAALRNPFWGLALGRKACVATVPVAAGGVVEAELVAALASAPLRAGEPGPRRIVVTDPAGAQSRPDVPVAPFSQRRFGMRRVRTGSVEVVGLETSGPSGP
jgi:CRISPR system Cascade subunit CasD